MTLTRETHVPASEAHWLEMRKLDATSTEVAALFGCSPYLTEYELHHRKAGTLPVDDFKTNERMVWGNRLESAIAYGIAEDFGLIVEPFKTYMRVKEIRLGASFDFKIVGIVDGYSGDETARDMFRRLGPGIAEIKNVDGLQFRRTWIEDGEQIEAPPHIELQAQAQLEVADLNWSIICPLVGGNTPKPIIRERDREIGAMICEKVRHFWAMVATGTVPQPDYTRDGKAIAALYRENDGSTVDLSGDIRLAALCAEYKNAGAAEKAAKERKDAARAEIITIIERAKSATTTGYKISAGTNKESYRCFQREENVRWTISRSVVPAADIEFTMPAFRNVRVSEAA